jgi:hypothetical protein
VAYDVDAVEVPEILNQREGSEGDDVLNAVAVRLIVNKMINRDSCRFEGLQLHCPKSEVIQTEKQKKANQYQRPLHWGPYCQVGNDPAHQLRKSQVCHQCHQQKKNVTIVRGHRWI